MFGMLNEGVLLAEWGKRCWCVACRMGEKMLVCCM